MATDPPAPANEEARCQAEDTFGSMDCPYAAITADGFCGYHDTATDPPALDLRAIRERLATSLVYHESCGDPCASEVETPDLRALLAAYDAQAARLNGWEATHARLCAEIDAQAARLAALEQAFVKVRGRWHIRTPHGSTAVADDIAYLVARAFEHPEWPENPDRGVG